MSESETSNNIRENKELGSNKITYSIVMVKPHALEEFSDIVIKDIFDGGTDKHLANLNLGPEAEKSLRSSKLITTFYRDLRDENNKKVLETFYAKESGKPQHQIIMDEYTGPCMFLLLSSNLDAEEYFKGMQKLKGRENLVDSQGKLVVEGSGIRGVLIKPRQMLDLNNLSDDDIRTITRNVVHVADTEADVAKALRMLMRVNELDELQKKNPALKTFIDKNDPTSIVRFG